MAASKTPGKTKTSQADAARAETNGKAEPKQITFRDLTLDLPAALPSTTILDLVEVEAQDNIMPLVRLVRSVLGAEQYTIVRNTIEPDDDIGEVISGLLGDIFGQYGLSLGESSASQDS